MSLLLARDVHYSRRGQAVLRAVELALAAGEVLGVIGPNGAGKTSLLRVLAGLALAHRGQVLLDGDDLAQLAPLVRARRLGYHPQRPELHWPLTVETVVALGRMPHAQAGVRRPSDDQSAITVALARCGLTAVRTRRCDSLSGGELARVHMARLLAGGHRVLLADEPIANLDPRFQLEILGALRAHAADGGGAIVVLHDLNIAARFCDRLLLLDQGEVSAAGSPQSVLTPARVARVFAVTSAYFTDAGIAQALAASRAATILGDGQTPL